MCSLFVRPYVYFYGLISPPDPWYRYRYSGVFCIHLIDRSQQLTFKLSSSWRINLLNLTLSFYLFSLTFYNFFLFRLDFFLGLSVLFPLLVFVPVFSWSCSCTCYRSLSYSPSCFISLYSLLIFFECSCYYFLVCAYSFLAFFCLLCFFLVFILVYVHVLTLALVLLLI